MIRIVLPPHLQKLAGVDGELALELTGEVSLRMVLEALESGHPVLRGTLRDHQTLERRPMVRFIACREDISHLRPDDPLPEAVTSGMEPFLVVGALSGG